EGYSTFEEWLDAPAEPPAPRADFGSAARWDITQLGRARSSPPPAEPKAGQFTKLFQPDVPTGAASQAGEFTRLFQSTAKPPDTAQTEPQPGEFTPRTPASEMPTVSMSAPPSQPQGGEFTRMFLSPVKPPGGAPAHVAGPGATAPLSPPS